MKLLRAKAKIINLLSIIGFVLSMTLSFAIALFYNNAQKNLLEAAENLRAIGNGVIYDTVYFDSTIPVDTEIRIERTIPVNLNMKLKDSLKIILTKKQSLSLKIPISIDIDKVLHIDTTLILPDTLKLTTNGNIAIDQKFTILRKFKIPLKSIIPLKNELLNARLQGSTTFISDIPIRMNIHDSLPIDLDLIIPIDQKAKIDYLVKNMALISFPKKLNIKGLIPIHLIIPIKISLSNTLLKKYLDSTAYNLNNILPIKF
ncbi:MAG: hypothetical protein WKG06_05785 [Segetibacter sp.]